MTLKCLRKMSCMDSFLLQRDWVIYREVTTNKVIRMMFKGVDKAEYVSLT